MNFQKKYTSRDILIIGGGTSTLDRNWDKIVNDRTFIWTCNDFFMNEKVCNQNIDLFQLGWTTDLKDPRLINKLRENKPFTYFEYDHYKTKWKEPQFKEFQQNIRYAVPGMNIPMGDLYTRPAQKSGAMFRLILLALQTYARNIYFVGFDGFNKDFSNAHAFTGHVGLKDTDTRRDYSGTPLSYMTVFLDAYEALANNETCKRLQNLGEGLDYNLGSRISKRFFPLRPEVYEAIR